MSFYLVRSAIGVIRRPYCKLRWYSSYCVPVTNSNARQRRCEIFEQEKSRQLSLINRVEKIEVRHVGPPEDCILLMNKGLSTPFSCAKHIQQLLCTRSVLALVNGLPWDMHRPLVEDCELRFLHFKDYNPSLCNQAFWRTGSFLLGYIIDRAFKEEYLVELCSFPHPDVQSGSFVYDVNLNMPNWKPTQAEMNCLSRVACKLQAEDLLFECLNVDAKLAFQMFENNRYKTLQIPLIAAQSKTGSTVTIYRLADHVDITRGPLISSTQQIGRFAVTAVHDIDCPDYGKLKRIQGLAVPQQLPIHFWSYELLCNAAANLNVKAPLPHSPSSGSLQHTNQ